MTHTAPPTRPVTNLPIWDTVAAAYRSVLQDNIQYLPRAMVGPMALSLVIGLIDIGLAPGPNAEPGAPYMLLSALISLLGMAPYVIFAVAWHRLVLLGPQVAAPTAMPSWQRRHWAFLAYSLLVSILFFGLLMIAGLIGGGFMAPMDGGLPAEPAGGGNLIRAMAAFALVLVSIMVLMRLSFVFPAIAVDERYGLGDAWRHTQGQGLRLLAAVTLASLPFVILLMLLSGLVVGALPDPNGGPADEPTGSGPGFLLLLVISVVVGYVWTAIGVSLLSIAFRTCSGWIPDTSGGPGSGPPANLGTNSTEE